METVVSILQDKLKWGRHFTCMVVAVCAFLIGIPSSLGNGVWANVKLFGMDFLTFFDYISNSVLMPIVAFLTCLFIGWVMKPDMFVKEIRLSSQFHREKLFPRGDPLHCAGVHCGDPHLLRVPACVTARRTRCGAGWPRGSQSPAARGGLAFLHKKNRKSSAKKAK